MPTVLSEEEKKDTHKRYNSDLERFRKAKMDSDLKSIHYFGDRIIWNEYLEQSDKKFIYETIKLLQENHPELRQLWKDVHYKVHGHEPLN